RRQRCYTCALVALRRGVIHLEDFHATELGQAPRAPVVSGAEDDELRRAGGDPVADRVVDRRGAKRDHVSHRASRLESETALWCSSRLLHLGEALLSLLVQEDARRWVLESRDVR